MQKSKIIYAVALLGMATLFGSCSKKSDSAPSYSMKASIGATSYNAPYCIAAVSGTQLVIDGLASSGSAPTPPYIGLSMTNWNGATGTFSLSDTTLANSGVYYTSSTDAHLSVSGSLIITSVSSTVISGTFSFTTDSSSVTNGTFTAKRQ